ncbi:UNVERIFIED_CONTAM: hypothetical protein PO554_26185, partial [Klebsiella pneumoniae]
MNAESYDDFEWYEKINATLVFSGKKLFSLQKRAQVVIARFVLAQLGERHSVSRLLSEQGRHPLRVN